MLLHFFAVFAAPSLYDGVLSGLMKKIDVSTDWSILDRRELFQCQNPRHGFLTTITHWVSANHQATRAATVTGIWINWKQLPFCIAPDSIIFKSMVFGFSATNTLTVYTKIHAPESVDPLIHTSIPKPPRSKDGFMVDVWWGITEPEPKKYNFAPYRRLIDEEPTKTGPRMGC